MRVPLSWLRDYVDFDLEPEALAERLTLLGMEVKSIQRIGADWHSVVVGELLEVARHPTAERLSLTKVRTGDAEPVLSIVCGATNIAAGQRVPVALPGALLPGDRAIEITRIAGVESQGMLCSGDELRLTTDADGILILDEDAPLGRPMAQLYGDVVLDVDVKPNRGDALSLIGLAREVAAAVGGQLRWPAFEVPEAGDATTDHLGVEVREPTLCARFVGRYLDALTVGPSPLSVQLRLGAAGIRPVSNVVDATNYVMMEMGKPTHAFDAAAIHEEKLIVRLAGAGEVLETLDHVRRSLTPDTLLITDPEKPLAIAGVMGGASSEVGDDTTSVVIESAIFDPLSIRRTARHCALRSEASARFEKGQESRLARVGADRVASLIHAWAGARVAVGAIDTAPIDPGPSRLAFRPARVSRLLGATIDADEMRHLLARVEIATEQASTDDRIPITPEETIEIADGQDGALVALVPTHRADLLIEADIAEEVARVRGYETVPAAMPATRMPGFRPDPRRFVDTIRDLLSAQGLNEVVTNALVGPRDHELLGMPADDIRTITVANPVSVDHSQLRRSLLPGLLRVLSANERQRRADVGVFEIGESHQWRQQLPHEDPALGILLAGEWGPGGWDAPRRRVDVAAVKGIVEWLIQRLLADAVTHYEPVEPIPDVEHPGQPAAIVVTTSSTGAEPASDMSLGRVGQLHPSYLAALGIRVDPVCFAIVHSDVLRGLLPGHRRIEAVSRTPAVERDLAVIVGRDRQAGQVERLIRARAGSLLRGLMLFDRYEGLPLGPDELSLAYRLRLQAPARTLTDEEVEAVMSNVVAGLHGELGARLRQ